MTAIVQIDPQVIWRSPVWPLRITYSAGEYTLSERVRWPGSEDAWCETTRSRSGHEIHSWAEIEEARLAAWDVIEKIDPRCLLDRQLLSAVTDALDAREPDEVRELICAIELSPLDEEWLLSEIEPYLRLLEQRLCGECKALRARCECGAGIQEAAE